MRNLIFITTLMISAVSWASGKDCMDDKTYPDISKAEMQKIVTAKKATIIDVNSEKSFKKARIPGAIHFAANKDNLAKVLPQDKNAPIVAYCGGKMCSAWKRAAQSACKMGYKNIRHFSEGIRGWTKKS